MTDTNKIINELTKEDMLNAANVAELIESEPFALPLMIERAKELKISTSFNALVKQIKKEQKKIDKAYSDNISKNKTSPSFIQWNGNSEKVNPGLLAEYFENNFTLLRAEAESTDKVILYSYKNGVYNKLNDDDLKGLLVKLVQNYNPSLVVWKDIETAKNIILTSSSNRISLDEFDNEDTLINFKNGILNLDTMELKEHSPEYRTSIQLNCNWDETKTDSPNVDKYLDSLTCSKKDMENLLYEYAGAAFSNSKGYEYKKALFIIGEGNTGKSKYMNLLQDILTNKYFFSIGLDQLERRFGAYYLFGKRLCGSPDMGFLNLNELKTFKTLTGGDSVFMEAKGQNAFSSVYNGFLLFIANEMPKFGGDKGQWVYDRMIIFRTEMKPISEEERDSKLFEKLKAEKEAFVVKAIKAYNETRKAGNKFTIPEACKNELRKYSCLNSSPITFFVECCEMWEYVDGEYKIDRFDQSSTTHAIYTIFREWSKDWGLNYIPSAQEFNKDIADYLKLQPETIKRKKDNEYYIFKLKAEAKRKYFSGNN